MSNTNLQKQEELFQSFQRLISNEENQIEQQNQQNQLRINLQSRFKQQKQLISQIEDSISNNNVVQSHTLLLKNNLQKISNKVLICEQDVQCIQDWELTSHQQQKYHKICRYEIYQQDLYQKEWMDLELQKWLRELCRYEWFQNLFQDLPQRLSKNLSRDPFYVSINKCLKLRLTRVKSYLKTQNALITLLLESQKLILKHKFKQMSHELCSNLSTNTPTISFDIDINTRQKFNKNEQDQIQQLHSLYHVVLTCCNNKQIQDLYHKFPIEFLNIENLNKVSSDDGDKDFDFLKHSLIQISYLIKIHIWRQKLNHCEWFQTLFREEIEQEFKLLEKMTPSHYSNALGKLHVLIVNLQILNNQNLELDMRVRVNELLNIVRNTYFIFRDKKIFIIRQYTMRKKILEYENSLMRLKKDIIEAQKNNLKHIETILEVFPTNDTLHNQTKRVLQYQLQKENAELELEQNDFCHEHKESILQKCLFASCIYSHRLQKYAKACNFHATNYHE